MIFFKT